MESEIIEREAIVSITAVRRSCGGSSESESSKSRIESGKNVEERRRVCGFIAEDLGKRKREGEICRRRRH